TSIKEGREISTVALTDDVKKELTATTITRPSARAAEVAAILRFAGQLHNANGQLAYEIELEDQAIADRLTTAIGDLYDIKVASHVVGPPGSTKKSRIQLCIGAGAKELTRRLVLVTRSGLPVVGLLPQVVSGSVADNEAACRGAFLAVGTLTEPGRSSSLEVVCPSEEAALALVGCARRLGIAAKTKETRGADRVVIRDGDAIGALLTRMGAQVTRLTWEDKRRRREARASENRLVNFDDANLRRSARAAVTAAARVERAMEILGDEVPEHLADAGSLRVQHRQASLEELGRLAEPQMTKDAVAGRIRRLLSMADRRAQGLGIPDTNEAINDIAYDAEE